MRYHELIVQQCIDILMKELKIDHVSAVLFMARHVNEQGFSWKEYGITEYMQGAIEMYFATGETK